MIFTSSLAVVGGFVFLVVGAERFVLGASSIARNFGVSPLIVGLTIVGFGTSAPEMLVSGVASWEGAPELAIGNAIGSNITNIALVLGVTAVIVPLTVKSEILHRELPVLLLTGFLGLFLLLDNQLGRIDGLILLAAMLGMMFWVVRLGLKSRSSDPIVDEIDDEMPAQLSSKKAFIWLLVGVVLLFASSHVLVLGATNIARYFGVSELLIGLTIIAIGTSLPELAATVMSALKNEHDLAIGNIIGSNMFNLLGVLALPGLISPGNVPESVLSRDYPIMLGLTVMLFLMAFGFRGQGRINRIEAVFLLAAYFGFLYLLYLEAMVSL